MRTVKPKLIHQPDSPSSTTVPFSSGIDLQKITTPLLLHMLQPEMRFPWLFLIRCKLTLGRMRRRIDASFPPDLIELAALPLWVYINLKSKIGEKRAFEIMRVVILAAGIAQWNLAYRAAEKERNFDNLCDIEI